MPDYRIGQIPYCALSRAEYMLQLINTRAKSWFKHQDEPQSLL